MPHPSAPKTPHPSASLVATLVEQNRQVADSINPADPALHQRNTHLLALVRQLLHDAISPPPTPLSPAEQATALTLALTAFRGTLFVFDTELQDQLLDTIIAFLDTHFGHFTPEMQELALALSSYVDFPDGNPYLLP